MRRRFAWTGVMGAMAIAALVACGGCSDSTTQPGVPQPYVRHLLFTSRDQAPVGETLYVTSEILNHGPGAIWFWRDPGTPPFDVAIGDTERVYTFDPNFRPGVPVSLDSLGEGQKSIAVLAFTGALWDSLGTPFDAPDGRYVVRRAFTYSRSRDLRDPITLPRGVDFRWVVP